MLIHYGLGIDKLTRNVAYSQGGLDGAGNIVDGSSVSGKMITPFDIFFNRIAILDVNFFNLSDDGSVIANIRNSVAAWYYVMRLIAAAILLCVLIYVGIRMAISTIASDKAAYKKMLVDWICSLGQFIEAKSADVNINVLNCDKAQKELGWRAKISLDIGVEKMTKYWNEETKEFQF